MRKTRPFRSQLLCQHPGGQGQGPAQGYAATISAAISAVAANFSTTALWGHYQWQQLRRQLTTADQLAFWWRQKPESVCRHMLRSGRVGHTKADGRAVMMLEPAQQQVQLQQAAMQPQRAVQSIASWSSLVGIVGDNSVESVVLVIAEVVSQVDQRDATHLLVDSGAFTYALWERERSWPSTYSFPCAGKSPVCYFLGIWHCPEMCWLFVGAGSARLGFLGAAALSEHGHDTHGAAGQLLACMVREGKLTRQVPMTTRNA